MSTQHPAGFRLDALAAGDPDDEARVHVDACDACRAYVDGLRAEAEAAPTDRDAARAFVARLAPSPSPAAARSRPRIARVAWVAGPLLAAALLFLVVRRPATPDERGAPSAETPESRFKGGIQLAVVLDRGGDQRRITSEVAVRPGDRLRVEVGIDSARPLVVGMLGKDGTWVVLLAPTTLEAGTHFSERAARFDETPTEGWILAGHPDDVERARMTKSFDRVRAIPVVLEP